MNMWALLLESPRRGPRQAAVRGSGRTRMKAFLLSVVVAIVLAVGGYFVVAEFQQQSEDAFATERVRL